MTSIFNNAHTSKIYHLVLLFISSLIMLLKAVLTFQPHGHILNSAFSITPSSQHGSLQICKYHSLLKVTPQNSESEEETYCVDH